MNHPDPVTDIADARIRRMTEAELLNAIADTAAVMADCISIEERNAELQLLRRLTAAVDQRRLRRPRKSPPA